MYHHQPTSPCRECTYCKRLGHTVEYYNQCKHAGAAVANHTPRACFECGSTDHLIPRCPKLVQWNNETLLGVNAEHQNPYGKLQPLEIPMWKWEHITMDLITKLPKTRNGYDTIWVAVDRLSKSAHFIPIKETYSSKKMAEIYVKEVVSRHGVPVTIVSDRDTRFTSHFWKNF
ncbi:hypothetical protein E3N88_07000 [Mikania micrantha]|uniref:Integrase catalytic domain-containing protein n=1 Tax=Mikania micrantha TaxID=192012 RepID=A0A5N6PQ94_9ASTR|nr:hypothetical protein E3N88_07000 [Mikania micrantha]